MKLSKYFLSAFAFIAAIGGSIASTTFDYAVSMGGSVIPIAEQGPTCSASNPLNATVCQGISAGGTTYRLFDNITVTNSELRSNTGQKETIVVQ